VNLVRHRDLFYFKEDYEEVLSFLNVDQANVTLLTGQVRWSKKKRPAGTATESSRGSKGQLQRGDA
jgi:hypothetical protein